MSIEGNGLRFKELKKKEDYVNALEQEVGAKTAKLKTYQIMPAVVNLFLLSFNYSQYKFTDII